MEHIIDTGQQRLTWTLLNTYLRQAGIELCDALMAYEQAHGNRPLFILRIHSRMNKVRASDERKKLLGVL